MQLVSHTMRCSSACTAYAYPLKILHEHFKKNYKVILYRDVLYVDAKSESVADPSFFPEVKEAFFFAYGSAVFWGLDPQEENDFLRQVKEFEHQSLDKQESETMLFSFGETAKIIENEIILPDQDLLTRLALSYGLAQSTKLGSFETAIQKTIDNTKQIPVDLATKGKISLSKKEIRRKMGELFIERNSVNLHFDALDTPEFFWEYSDLKPLYAMIANDLEIESRVDILNQRLNIVHELFEMLGNELNHQHSSKLEWIIIWLIVIEVTLSLLKDVFELI